MSDTISPLKAALAELFSAGTLVTLPGGHGSQRLALEAKREGHLAACHFR